MRPTPDKQGERPTPAERKTNHAKEKQTVARIFFRPATCSPCRAFQRQQAPCAGRISTAFAFQGIGTGADAALNMFAAMHCKMLPITCTMAVFYRVPTIGRRRKSGQTCTFSAVGGLFGRRFAPFRNPHRPSVACKEPTTCGFAESIGRQLNQNDRLLQFSCNMSPFSNATHKSKLSEGMLGMAFNRNQGKARTSQRPFSASGSAEHGSSPVSPSRRFTEPSMERIGSI